MMQCEICHTPVEKPIVYIKDDNNLLICPRCASFSGTCGFCVKSGTCSFEQSTINIPKVEQVVQNIQGGQFITTVKNKARIAETCEKGCKCWDNEEKMCLREFNTCKNYEMFLMKNEEIQNV